MAPLPPQAVPLPRAARGRLESQHPPHRRRTVRRKELVEVRQRTVVRHRGITEHRIVGLALGDCRHRLVRHITVEAREEEAVRDIKDAFPRDLLHRNWLREQDAEIQHRLKEHILRRTIRLDIVNLREKSVLRHRMENFPG